jgi:hypothetical protein
MNEEELAAYFEAKDNDDIVDLQEEEEDELETIQSNELLPTLRDPNLWIVKVQFGREKNALLRLFRKFISQANAGDVSHWLVDFFMQLNKRLFSATLYQFHLLSRRFERHGLC